MAELWVLLLAAGISFCAALASSAALMSALFRLLPGAGGVRLPARRSAGATAGE